MVFLWFVSVVCGIRIVAMDMQHIEGPRGEFMDRGIEREVWNNARIEGT